jgi:hypothetical protein
MLRMPELNDLPFLGEVLLYLLYPIRRDALDWGTFDCRPLQAKWSAERYQIDRMAA